LSVEILQGSLAAYFWHGGKIHSSFCHLSSLNTEVKETLKWNYVCQSFRDNMCGTFVTDQLCPNK